MLNYTENTLTGKNDKLFLALQGNFDPSKYKRLQMGLTENLRSFSNYLYNSPEENSIPWLQQIFSLSSPQIDFLENII